MDRHVLKHAKEAPKSPWAELARKWCKPEDVVAALGMPAQGVKRKAGADQDTAGGPKVRRGSSSSGERTLVVRNQATLHDFFGPAVAAQEKVRNALSMFCLEHGLPASLVESPALAELLDVVREVAKSPQTGVAKLTTSELLCGRKTFAACMATFAEGFTKKQSDAKLKLLNGRGATLTVDSRTNVNGVSITVMNVESKAIGMVPLVAVPAESGAKDARAVATMVVKALATSSFGEQVVCVCMDGASVNVKAFAYLEREENLLTIRCQSHLMSLFIKDLFKLEDFKEVKPGLELLYSFVRQNQRVWTRFLELSKSKVLFRPMEIRFASYVTALHRALEMRNTLLSLLDDKEFKTWLNAQKPEKKDKAKTLNKLIRNTAFWEKGEFLMRVADPAVWGLRILDQFHVSAGFAASVWDSLGARLLQLMSESKTSSSEPDSDDASSSDSSSLGEFCAPAHMKTAILRAYLTRAEEASCDVLDAAWVCAPRNWDEVTRLASSARPADKDSWRAIRASCHAVFGKLANRCVKDKDEGKQKRLVLETITALTRELDEYSARSGTFASLEYNGEDSQAWWTGTTSTLGSYAVKIIQGVVVTISNTERLHKVFSLVHTDKRNRLAHERATQFSQAAFWLRSMRLPAKASDASVGDFTVEEGLPAEAYENFMEALTAEAATVAAVRAGADVQETEEALEAAGTDGADVDDFHGAGVKLP